ERRLAAEIEELALAARERQRAAAREGQHWRDREALRGAPAAAQQAAGAASEALRAAEALLAAGGRGGGRPWAEATTPGGAAASPLSGGGAAGAWGVAAASPPGPAWAAREQAKLALEVDHGVQLAIARRQGAPDAVAPCRHREAEGAVRERKPRSPPLSWPSPPAP
ncbi:unnamed protein product, partial [Prorocentrum cordatum]